MRADAKAQGEDDSGEREHAYAVACRQAKFRPATDGSTSENSYQYEQLRPGVFH
jgi:hypothetical protein